VIEHMKQRVKVAEVVEASKLDEEHPYHHGTTQIGRTEIDYQMISK
jgi:hypothetical protein